MEQAFGKYLMFKNRLEKVYRHLGKQARRQELECWRVYDHDLPEFPFSIDFYGDALYVNEYRRNHAMSPEEHAQWLDHCQEIMTAVLGVPAANIFIKTRQRKEGRTGQYQKVDEARKERIVKEAGLQFIVNLSDYLDTGLFPDHRITRQLVREAAGGKTVLNLFAYTGAFSVYAAAGGAERVITVDLSKTYLQWAERNMALNLPNYTAHQTVHADVKQYLEEVEEASADLIVMDPPTFSNSKRMEDILDIQRDHPTLINHCLRALRPGGQLYFSTNFTRFELQSAAIRASSLRDITRSTTPFDFPKLKRPCFLITK
jgi:23S rRNA (cytosine1962-C5)-methyltransferase